MPSDLIATSEAADMLRRSPAQVARYAADGTLDVAYRAPGKKGALFFERADVARLAEQRRREALAEWSDTTEPAEAAS